MSKPHKSSIKARECIKLLTINKLTRVGPTKTSILSKIVIHIRTTQRRLRTYLEEGRFCLLVGERPQTTNHYLDSSSNNATMLTCIECCLASKPSHLCSILMLYMTCRRLVVGFEPFRPSLPLDCHDSQSVASANG